MYKLLQYKYSDTPDGQDGFKKLFYNCKYGAMTGGVVGLFDLVFYSQVHKFTSKLNVIGAYIVPCVGYTAIFTSTVYMATNLRGKDDKWNYFLGALTLSGIFGIVQKNMRHGYSMLGIIGPLAVGYKYGKQHGLNILEQNITSESVQCYHLRNVKDYPKSYTRSS